MTAQSTEILTQIATRPRSADFFAPGLFLPNPDPILRKEGKDLRVYQELLADPRVGACAEQRKAAVRALSWSIARNLAEPPHAELVRSIFAALDIDRIMNEILNAPLFGYQPLEVLWQHANGRLIPGDVQGKPPRWFVFDQDNALRLRTRDNLIQGEPVPARKFLLARHNPSFENPYGERVLARVFWPVVFKKGGLRFWLTCVEKFGVPYLVGKHPRGMGQEEIDAIARRLEDAVQDAVLVIPDDASIDIKESNRVSTGTIFQQLKSTCDQDIAVAILGQNLTTSVQSGSLSAAQVHDRVRGEIKDSDAKIVARVLNQLILWIMELNFPNHHAPVFLFEDDARIDPALAQRDKMLMDSGRIRFTKRYFQRAYGLEDDDFDVMT